MIKTEFKELPQKDSTKFPCLMICKKTNLVILVTGETETYTGIVLMENRTYSLGTSSSCWIKSEFEPFYGTVTLTSEKE